MPRKQEWLAGHNATGSFGPASAAGERSKDPFLHEFLLEMLCQSL